MNVSKFLQNLPFQNVSLISKSGADGEVYQDEKYVYKLSIVYDHYHSLSFDYDFNQTINILKNLSFKSDPAFVNIIKFQDLLSGYRHAINGKQKYHIYFYQMPKLLPISEDEKKALHTLLCHEDNNLVKKLNLNLIKELSNYLDFDFIKMKKFLSDIEASAYLHLDMHTRNIMKDDSGNFKLIDLDRITIK